LLSPCAHCAVSTPAAPFFCEKFGPGFTDCDARHFVKSGAVHPPADRKRVSTLKGNLMQYDLDFFARRAPGLQPVDTGVATPRDHAGGMAKSTAKKERELDTACGEPLPTLKAGREVGWFFVNGEAVAIERHETEARNTEDAT
jgi:hypothetical protein